MFSVWLSISTPRESALELAPQPFAEPDFEPRRSTMVWAYRSISPFAESSHDVAVITRRPDAIPNLELPPPNPPFKGSCQALERRSRVGCGEGVHAQFGRGHTLWRNPPTRTPSLPITTTPSLPRLSEHGPPPHCPRGISLRTSEAEPEDPRTRGPELSQRPNHPSDQAQSPRSAIPSPPTRQGTHTNPARLTSISAFRGRTTTSSTSISTFA